VATDFHPHSYGIPLPFYLNQEGYKKDEIFLFNHIFLRAFEMHAHRSRFAYVCIIVDMRFETQANFHIISFTMSEMLISVYISCLLVIPDKFCETFSCVSFGVYNKNDRC